MGQDKLSICVYIAGSCLQEMAMYWSPRRYEWVMINCLFMFILQVLSPRNGYVLATKEI